MKKTKIHGTLAILGGKPTFTTPISITKPTLPKKSKLLKKYAEILDSGQITNSRYVSEFERKVAAYLGVKHAIALNSCTTGLIFALKLLGVKGKVIVPSFSFCATAHAIVWAGLEPVFVDCESDSLNIDPQKIEEAITPDTTCIIGVHIFGSPANVKRLEEIAQRHGLKLIFDAAHGFGSQINGHNLANSGDAEVFSLSPTKLLTCAEGGILTTNHDDLASKVRIARNYGNPGNYDCEFIGLSARMSEFNAALGCESIEMLEKNVIRRNEIAELYKRKLKGLPGITFQEIASGNRSSYKDFSIKVSQREFGLSRDVLAQALKSDGIDVKKYFDPPIHKQKAYANIGNSSSVFPVTEKVCQQVLSLPLYSHMKTSDVMKICQVMHDSYSLSAEINQKIS